ncbi:MAG: alanyl-tRNA editing protein [Candidatus Nanohaloarchaea archaeon]
MTELLYLPDNNYAKEFDAEVVKSHDEDRYVVLDRTLFYKEGGGQPADHGTLSWNGQESKVVDVKKKHGEIRHYLDGEVPGPGEEVHGLIDWERRYKHMRMHTAQHVLSKVVLDMYDGTTAGNQIHEDYSRIDFEPVEFDEEDVEKIEEAANRMIDSELEVRKKNRPRESLEEEVQEGRTNLDLIPDHVDPLRAVYIGDVDVCPCGGTHVDNTKEIGRINITNRVSKGADVERLEFELED